MLVSVAFQSERWVVQHGGSFIAYDSRWRLVTRFLLHRHRAGQLWRLRELHETTWDVTEIWIRCGEGDLGLGPPDGPEVRAAHSIAPPQEEPPVLPCTLNSITEPPVTVGAPAGSSAADPWSMSLTRRREPHTIISELNTCAWSVEPNVVQDLVHLLE